ncbi:PH domain-containing protein [Haloprofundus marisrubri]|uniref:PH domain-containing protein n=1 Tax=Haloprofundus marisrubri TaxID=1514971 RepID=UPI0008F82CEE|nr:PH domain-containing protein [Haloprofundus marisrubri]
MKLSPLSVPYRVAQKAGSLLFSLVILLFTGATGLVEAFGASGLLLALGGLVALGVALVGYEVAYYQRYEYELTADTFDIRSGVFSRRTREIPLARIQNVDIRRNVVQRFLDIAAVDFETAGGSETEAAIRFVSFSEAKRLQRDIGRRKRGDADDDESATDETDLLFALSDRELALVGLLSFDLRVPGLVAFLASSSVPILSSAIPSLSGLTVLAVGGLLLAAAVLLFSWVVGITVAVLNYYGFRLSQTTDELRYERGLVQRYDGSIPFEKVQTLTVEDNPLKRRFGYATLVIETAGYAPGQGGSYGSEAAVPLARVDRVLGLARDIDAFGEFDFERPPKRIRRRYVGRYLIALGVILVALYSVNYALGGSYPWYAPAIVLPLLPIAAHYKWKHRGYWLDDRHIVTRNGFWTRQTRVVPYHRIQTVIDTQTIFQRRWRVATVTVDTAGSRSLAARDAAAVDIDRDEAKRLRATLETRLQEALVARRREAARDDASGPSAGSLDVAGGDADATDTDATDAESSDSSDSSEPSPTPPESAASNGSECTDDSRHSDDSDVDSTDDPMDEDVADERSPDRGNGPDSV